MDDFRCEHRVSVALDLPHHGDVSPLLDYKSEQALLSGSLVRVPLGKRVVRGVCWDAPEPHAREGIASPDDAALRGVISTASEVPPLSQAWRALVTFAASYYQRSIGEVAMAALPPQLRQCEDEQLARVVHKLMSPAEPLRKMRRKKPAASSIDEEPRQAPSPVLTAEAPPELTQSQRDAIQAIQAHAGTTLLHGVTGSGKTEVYLQVAQAALEAGRQVLVLVPEINLTPQLESRLAARFGAYRMASLHSGLTPAQRLRHWLSAHLGLARVVLGTRLAVFASMPDLGLVIVDEEHDPSFKQQEGARYSARDLAVYRGQSEGVPVVLGSATPSLETWRRAQEGRYQKLVMRERIGDGAWPALRLIDMGRIPREQQRQSALAAPLIEALKLRLERREQSLVLLNRRGYQPVLHCTSCGWKSACPHCSAWRVFHKVDRTLRCHHCGSSTRVPRACPECGDIDLGGIGRGTQKLEEQIAQMLPTARVARIDADTVRRQGALASQLLAVHEGDVDVLVGTQMVAKGHDFRRVTLVAVVDPDGALFTSDFRAPERLFSLLMQAAGRAGRDAAHAKASEIWIQTWHPAHPVFTALRSHDFDAFAATQLEERQRAGLPPWTSLALLRADARSAEVAEAFLRDAAAAAQHLPDRSGVTVYPPVPLHVARVADVERMQMLVESPSRVGLQRMLTQWHDALHEIRARHKGVIRFAIDVDPLAI